MANYQKLIKYARTYTRRAFLKTGLSGVAGLTLMTNFSGCQSLDLAAINQPLAPTPNCDDGDHEPTQRDAEGPFYTPDTPERSLFVGDDDPGTRLLVTGRVPSICRCRGQLSLGDRTPRFISGTSHSPYPRQSPGTQWAYFDYTNVF